MSSRVVLLIVYLSLVAGSGGEERLRDVIDHEIQAVWRVKKVQPAPPATDAEFLRRVYLDLLGIIPSHEQARAFIDDKDAGKREKLIASLVKNSRFGLHQSDFWDMVYFGRNPPGYGTDKRQSFRDWLGDQFNRDVSYRSWTRAILRAEGNTVEHGAPMFFVQFRNRPEDATEAVSRHFLGLQLQCARCHDHPFDSWSQTDFYGMAAFFARLRVVNVGRKKKLAAYAIGERNTGQVMFSGPATQAEPGKKGTPVAPKFLGGRLLAEKKLPSGVKEPRNFASGKMPPKPIFSRKDALADWITSPGNPYFARSLVNRVWAQFMGKGIVHPVDNFSQQNPPSHPQLLDALTKQFVEHDFRLKWLISEILNSKTYQLSGRGTTTASNPAWYERARCRPLSAEELFESWVRASGYDKTLAAGKKTPGQRFRLRGITWEYIRRAFGQPNDGQGGFQGGLHEHLYLNNGQVRQLISTRKGGLLSHLMDSKDELDKRLERLFLGVLSRRPSKAETDRFVSFLSPQDDSRGRWHDAIWTLMTCSEFRFNH